MTTQPDPKNAPDDDDQPGYPDPADEAAEKSDGPGTGADGSVPGAATAGAGGAKKAREADE